MPEVQLKGTDPAPAPPWLQAKDLVLHYGPRLVLDHASLFLSYKEIVTLLGPNGSGKTSLVRTLLGLQRPRSGSLVYPPGFRPGYLPQVRPAGPAECIPLSAERSLALHPGYQDVQLRTMALDLAQFLKSDLPKPFHQLSGGQRQKLLLARALLNRPNFLVLDEPTCHLDLKAQVQLPLILSEIREQFSCSILLVSHDLHLVLRQSDRVVCFNHSVQCTGRPIQLGHIPKFQGFLDQHGFRQAWALYGHQHRAVSLRADRPGNHEGGVGHA